MAITGHATAREILRYTKGVDLAKLALEAVERLEVATTKPRDAWKNAAFYSMANASMAYAQRRGKPLPYLATAIQAILAKVANSPAARHRRCEGEPGRCLGHFDLGDFATMYG
jgi:hypothetical protein